MNHMKPEGSVGLGAAFDALETTHDLAAVHDHFLSQRRSIQVAGAKINERSEPRYRFEGVHAASKSCRQKGEPSMKLDEFEASQTKRNSNEQL